MLQIDEIGPGAQFVKAMQVGKVLLPEIDIAKVLPVRFIWLNVLKGLYKFGCSLCIPIFQSFGEPATVMLHDHPVWEVKFINLIQSELR
ncbi:hypothetical protein GGP41_004099 [Bipolaris sorokiniana]|uniref:Uncharacterized protein n=1 Tax=Cochliobolus sativus TaxID=45130 RepID=A0A8H6DYL6_COCSA|nr:hypothetical protein GGP41_004099 [Bipolaris sorokiniana]